MEACEKLMNWKGASRMETPATTAVSTRPDWIACTALSRATSEDEQAVSTMKLGPFRSKT